MIDKVWQSGGTRWRGASPSVQQAHTVVGTFIRHLEWYCVTHSSQPHRGESFLAPGTGCWCPCCADLLHMAAPTICWPTIKKERATLPLGASSPCSAGRTRERMDRNDSAANDWAEKTDMFGDTTGFTQTKPILIQRLISCSLSGRLLPWPVRCLGEAIKEVGGGRCEAGGVRREV